MTEDEAFDGANRMTDVAVRTAYPDATDRQFNLEACAYATERAEAYQAAVGEGVYATMAVAYAAVARRHAKLAKKLTDERLTIALS